MKIQQMKTPQHRTGPPLGAFTLVEMLVVIAIMGILAAMIFPVAGAIKKKTLKTRAQSELAQVEAAIERYKTKLGFYPPDNWPNLVSNQLYFELLGTSLTTNGDFRTLDGSAQINAAGPNGVQAVFGGRVSGFVNSSRAGGGEDGPVAATFLTGLKLNQMVEFAPGVRLLVCSVRWPDDRTNQPLAHPDLAGLNPWRYDSSSTNRHNRESYDLWVDILVGGKTNRINNWSKQPEILQ